MTGADWLLDALSAEGVDRLVGNPGSTELPIVEALGRHSDVRYVLALHESVAMGIADGYAQQSGRLAAVNVHVQPGMANALSGVLNARNARVPLLVTVGQQVGSLLPSAPFLGGDVVGMAAPLAKAAFEPRSPAELRDALAAAVRTALRPPRGPVVLSIPLELQAGPPPEAHSPAPPAPLGPPEPGLVGRMAELLRSARRPLLVVGDGVGDSGGGEAATVLAGRLGAPIFGEPMPGRISVPTDHPLYRRPLPPFAAEIHPILAEHDVVLACGMPAFRLFGTSPGEPVPSTTALLHIDTDPREVERSDHRLGAVADPASALSALVAELGPPDDEAAARRMAAVRRTAELRREARRAVVAAAGASGFDIGPAAFSLALADATGPNDLLVDEALTSTRSLRVAVGRRTPGTWLAHRGSALGWGLPAAVGAKMAEPGRRVMVAQGDGGLLFGVQALWTAAREGLPVALVVADNRGYEILRAGMEGYTGRPEGPWPGLALDEPPIDVAGLVAAYGASVAAVDDRRELRAALDDLWRRTADGPAVLVARVRGRTAPVGYPLDTPSPEPGRPERG